MSADNFYIVRRHEGGFTPVMGFASVEETPTPRKGAKVYPTPEDALDAVAGEYTEYGASIHPECYVDAVETYAYKLSGEHVGMWFGDNERHQVTRVVQSKEAVEVHTTYGAASFRPTDVVEIFWREHD